MKKKVATSVVAVLLTGCVSIPTPQNRADWEAVHSRVYAGKSSEEVLDAAERILRSADKDFKFDYPDGKLVATRAWSVFFVIGGAGGTDYWEISALPVDDGVKATTRITRANGATYVAPVVGGGGGATVGSSSTPGQPLQWRPTYDLFWSRMDYMLDGSGRWITCKEFEKGKGRADTAGIDTICSVTTDDGPAPARR